MTSVVRIHPLPPTYFARMAELADALDSGSSVRKDVEVQVLSTAPLDIKDLRVFFFSPCYARIIQNAQQKPNKTFEPKKGYPN